MSYHTFSRARCPFFPRVRFAAAIALSVVSLFTLASVYAEPAPASKDAEASVSDGAGAAQSANAASRAVLQVPSPDWAEQIVYFVMTDRFFDGNPKNSDQKKGEYDPGTNAKYSGGDLAGIAQKIDYIRGLGATAVWITPPVANQWWDPMNSYGGYHGYWAENLVKVDRHLGTLKDYQSLSLELHRNGMYLIQDIVPNHVGNFFRMVGTGRSAKYIPNSASEPVSAPTQAPFDLNDFTDPGEHERAIYHWTGNIARMDNDTDRWTGQLSDLDDLNTGNPEVVEALKKSYGYWIRNAGVDAFRVDTVKYVEHEFWNDFLWSTDPASPGIMETARKNGKTNFVAFGETWNANASFSDEGDRQSAAYLGTAEKPELNGILNFSLQFDMAEVFARGKSTDRLAWRMASLKRTFGDLTRLYNFVDNHDMNRFLESATVEDLETALLFMYTIPGVPVIYYGTEQGFTDVRAAMFANGYNSGGVDRFDTGSRLYRYLAGLACLRKADRAFTRGDVRFIGSTAAGPGILAYRSDIPGGRTMVTVINTAARPYLGANLALGIPGASLKPVYALRASAEPLSADSVGGFSVLLPAKAAIVYAVEPTSMAQTGQSPSPAAATAGPAPDAPSVTGTPGVWKTAGSLSGSTGGLRDARVVIDGNWDRGMSVSGQFSVDIGIDGLSSGAHSAVVAGVARNGGLSVSPAFPFTVGHEWTLALSVADPAGDDAGPAGKYRYPLDSTFRGRQCDIARIEVYTAGTAVRLVFTMNGDISTAWGPPHRFDHTCFYIYFSFPGSASAVTAMPRQNSALPDGMTWDFFSQIGGWNNWFWSSKGADASTPGTALTGTPEISVDGERRTIAFTYQGNAFDGQQTLSGLRIYAATWDYDGMSSANRLLERTPGDWSFGGGDFAKDPLVMDSIGPLTLK